MKGTELKVLFRAIRQNDLVEVKRLVAELGVQVLKRRRDFQFPLTAAAVQNRPAIVSALLDFGVDPNQCDDCTVPPLYDAAEAGHAEVVKILLERGARPDDAGCTDETPLHRAICGGHVAVAKLLVAAGADVQRKNPDGRTSLEHAAHEGYAEITDLLLLSGATSDRISVETLRTRAKERNEQRGRIAKWAKDKAGEKLFYAAAKGELGEVQRLVRSGVNPNGVTKDRKHVALSVAAKWGHIEVIRFLLSAGAEVNLREEDGETALFSAVSRGDDDIVKVLLAAGADPNLTPRHRTLIEEATFEGWPSCVQLLARAGADLNGCSVEEIEAAAAAECAKEQNEVSVLLHALSKHL